MKKYGFVYIWRDRKHKRYYIGCHWGTDFDGYVCSSNWMRNSYRKRPEDFKRRILKTNIKNKKKTINEEYKWLKLIKEKELGKKYYNLIVHKQGPLLGGVKRGNIPWNKGKSLTQEHRDNLKKSDREKKEISERMKGNKRFLGKTHTEEAKQKVSLARKGKPLSQEHCEKLSQSHKGKPWSENRRSAYERRKT